MPEFEIRTDVLSGGRVALPQQPGKSLHVRPRDIPRLDGPCPFCAIEHSLGTLDDPITNQGVTSLPVYVSDGAFALTNAWPAYGPRSHSILIMSRRHVESVDELSDEESRAFFSAILAVRRPILATTSSLTRTLTLINVGRGAGASQPHLHAQIMSVDTDAPAMFSTVTSQEAISEDVAVARRHGLMLHDDATATVYVAWSPTSTGEVRCVAQGDQSLADGVRIALAYLTDAFGPMDYHIVIAGEETVVAQVMPSFVQRHLFSDYFGLACATISPTTLLKNLRGANVHDGPTRQVAL
jgi:diadenosine tetraphosphate (Ap4A) HIT family hydrolase